MKTAASKAAATRATKQEGEKVQRRALRPALIETLYGIPKSTLRFYCDKLPEAERLPCVKLPGRKSATATHPSMGARLVFVDDLEAWLASRRTPRGKVAA